jgi:DNA-binding MarR family transcriptional regulator
VHAPNDLPSPNDFVTPNDTLDRAALIDRVMAGFDAFMQRMAVTHADEFADVDLTMSQAKVLYQLQAMAPLRLSELAARLGVGLSTTSGLVERLVEAALVDRRDDPADRRQVVLTLTEAGHSRLDLMRELNAGHMRRMLAEVSDADLLTVGRSIEILAQAAGRLRPEPSPAPRERDPS